MIYERVHICCNLPTTSFCTDCVSSFRIWKSEARCDRNKDAKAVPINKMLLWKWAPKLTMTTPSKVQQRPLTFSYWISPAYQLVLWTSGNEFLLHVPSEEWKLLMFVAWASVSSPIFVRKESWIGDSIDEVTSFSWMTKRVLGFNQSQAR